MSEISIETMTTTMKKATSEKLASPTETEQVRWQEKRYPRHWWSLFPQEEAYEWEILPHTTQPPWVILSKRNELGLLSNFADTPFTLDGERFASLEGFWHSMKYPEGPEDPRAQFEGIKWKHTRQEVAAMLGFEAILAGDLADANMKKMGIDWSTFQGKKYIEWTSEKGEHFELILRATRAKLAQNPRVAEVLKQTGDLILLPDHEQPADAPPAWQYFQIYMDIRNEL